MHHPSFHDPCAKTRNSTPFLIFREKLGHEGHSRDDSFIVHAHRSKYSERALHLIVRRVARRDEGEMLARVRNFVKTQLDVDRFGRFDAAAKQRDEAVLFLDCFQQLADLLLIREIRRGGDLRGAINVDFSLGAIAENAWVAEEQSVAGDEAVLLAVALDLQAKIGAHGFESPANVLIVQKTRDAIEILLAERTLGANQLVARDASGGNQYNENAIIRKEEKAHMFDDAARQRRRNKNAQPARNGCENMACTLHHRFGRLRGLQFAANPLAVFRAGRGLRSYLLDKETVRRGRRYPSGRSVGLIEVAFVFQVGHDVAHSCRAELFDMTARDTSRGDGLASLDVRAHHVGENLLVPPLL